MPLSLAEMVLYGFDSGLSGSELGELFLPYDGPEAGRYWFPKTS